MPANQPQTQQPYTFSQEVYGFARFISSTALLVIYLGFAFIPNQTLEQWGVIFYPAKYWFCAIPAVIIFVVIGLIFNYISFNMRNTHSPYRSDCFLRDNLSRRIRSEDIPDAKELYDQSLKLGAYGSLDNNQNDQTTQSTKTTKKQSTTTARTKQQAPPHGEKIAQIYRDIDIDPTKVNPVDHRPILDPYDLAPTLLTNHLLSNYRPKWTTYRFDATLRSEWIRIGFIRSSNACSPSLAWLDYDVCIGDNFNSMFLYCCSPLAGETEREWNRFHAFESKWIRETLCWRSFHFSQRNLTSLLTKIYPLFGFPLGRNWVFTGIHGGCNQVIIYWCSRNKTLKCKVKEQHLSSPIPGTKATVFHHSKQQDLFRCFGQEFDLACFFPSHDAALGQFWRSCCYGSPALPLRDAQLWTDSAVASSPTDTSSKQH